jgi:hypothetical protein
MLPMCMPTGTLWKLDKCLGKSLFLADRNKRAATATHPADAYAYAVDPLQDVLGQTTQSDDM